MNIIKPAELLFCRLLFLRRCIHRCRRRHGTGARNACGRAQRMRQKIKLSFLATSVITAALALSPEIPGMGEKPAPSSDETAVYAGIDGMTDCVECMRSFYIAGQAKRLESASDEILAGTRALNRCAINRSAFARQVMRAGELGYAALQIIAENQMSYNDYYTLLQIVEAEATGGDLHSKQLIANVVLNRVNDPRFPDSIYDVVWQRVDGQAQFSPTSDGRIYSCTITGTTIEAVERALSGEDESDGALFFFARRSSSGSSVEWFEENLVKLYEYGGHEFFTFKDDKKV